MRPAHSSGSRRPRPCPARAIAAFSFLEAGLGHSLIHGDEGLVFLGMLGVGLAFEGAWYVARGTNAVSSYRLLTA